MSGFITKVDFSNNRQVKQYTRTETQLSGATDFGVTFSALTSGADLTTSAITSETLGVYSTFSGNSGTTVFTFGDSDMALAISELTVITSGNSGNTQYVLATTATSTTTIDGNTVNLTYSGVVYDLSVTAMTSTGAGTWSGETTTDSLIKFTAGTLDFTGRTIWADVNGITRTQKLIVTNNPQIGYVLTCSDSEGMASWASVSGGTSATTLWSAGSGSDSIVAEYSDCTATGAYCVTFGNLNLASNDASHAQGYQTTSSGKYAHSEGEQTIASGDYSHAEGSNTSALRAGGHAEGVSCVVTGTAAHAEGYFTSAYGDYSHAEGFYSTALGDNSHAEGGWLNEGTYYRTTSVGDGSHAEGIGTTANTSGSHAEGFQTIASGNNSHAEGSGTIASGTHSHTEGSSTTAAGVASHAEGINTTASGNISHVSGYENIAASYGEFVVGRYNYTGSSASTSTWVDTDQLFVVGNGTGVTSQNNALTVYKNGNAILDGDFSATTFYGGGSGLTGITDTVLETIYLTYSGTSGTTSGTKGCTLTAPGEWTVTHFGASYYLDDSGGDLIITIPDSDASNEGKTLIVSKPRLVESNNNITIKTVSGQKIAQNTEFKIYAANERYELCALNFGGGGAPERKYRLTLGTDNEPNILKVSQYGALYNTIEDAVDFANSYLDYGTIMINPGIYTITEPLVINTNVTLMGYNVENTILTMDPSISGESMFIFTKNSGLEHLTLSGQSDGNAIELSGASICNFNHLKIVYWDKGYCMTEPCSIRLFDNRVNFCTTAGICNLGAGNIRISESTIKSNGYGINLFSGSTAKFVVQNTVFDSNTVGVAWNTTGITYNYAIFMNNVFDNNTTTITGFTWDILADADVRMEQNAGLPDYSPAGYLSQTGGTTLLTSQNVYYKLTGGTNQPDAIEYKFSVEDNKMTYLSKVPRVMDFLITADLQLNANNQNVRIAIIKNGTDVVSSTLVRFVSAGVGYNVALSAIHEAAQNDYFEIHARNETSGNDTISINLLNFSIKY